MNINDTSLDGSTSYLGTVEYLQAVAGKISCFSEFTPTRFPFREIIYVLMSAFLRDGNCFYLSDSIYYVAGVLDVFKCATLYIYLTDIYITRLRFQRIESPTFYYFYFTCELLNSAPDDDLYIYKVTRDDFSMKVFVFGVDVYKNCGPLSNVDFIYFVWQNFERISSKQYAITLIPSDINSLSTPPRLLDLTSLSTPRLLCLKYYRAASDGWKDASNCDICVEQYQA
jgi:hypothetical protein